MWKRDEVVRPPTGGRDAGGPAAPAASPFAGAQAVSTPEIRTKGHMDKDAVNIGKSVVIKGELTGSEDLTVEGSVEGKIELRDHVLTIGANGRIKAEVFAKVVVVVGEVVGNITAAEKVDIRENGSVDGNIVSPRVAIAESAHFRGTVDMQKTHAVAPAPAAARPEPKPEARPAPPPTGPSQVPGGQRMVGA
jgi:cytoskeletal protein CcmA (bactofilin family)